MDLYEVAIWLVIANGVTGLVLMGRWFWRTRHY